MNSDIRTRNWVFIAYPENISENDLDSYLDSLQIECVRSPLHSPVGDGIEDERKAHWHILLCFNGVKSFAQVSSISHAINGSHPVVCHSVRGSVRYFVHADNPEKEQFENGKLELKAFCGLNVFDLFCPTSAEKDFIVSEMQSWVRKNKIIEFCELFDYAQEHHFETWYYMLNHGSANLMHTYITSIRNKQKGDICITRQDIDRIISKRLSDFAENGTL